MVIWYITFYPRQTEIESILDTYSNPESIVALVVGVVLLVLLIVLAPCFGLFFLYDAASHVGALLCPSAP